MKVKTAEAINKQFDKYAEKINETAMADKRERLMEINEAKRRQFLKAFETEGEIEVKATGIYWRLIEKNKSNLQFWRKARGMSQSQLAEKSGVDIRMIQHYEQGTKDINKAQVITVLQLAEALDVDINDIINAR